MKTAIIENNILIVDGVGYDIRYVTNDGRVVCNTDKLRGAYGDEYPLEECDVPGSDEPVYDINYEKDLDPYFN